jgi:hexosaminidase
MQTFNLTSASHTPTVWATFLLCLSGLMSLSATSADVNLIPRPVKFESRAGDFPLQRRTRILVEATAQSTGHYLAERLKRSSGLEVPVDTAAGSRAVSGCILLTTKNAKPSLGNEGYELEVRPKSVVIRATSPAGLFYGVQTFLQLLPAGMPADQKAPGNACSAPCVQIEDQPRFAWRGVLLDVARHFFTKDELKRYIDEIALYKINVLQLHLTDDVGWRVEIKKHPRLTEVGAWRTAIGFNLDPKSSTAYGPDGRYGGFYTQADLRELVAYGQSRFVTILPEIEMPGHAGAALAAYPNLSCSGQPFSTDGPTGATVGVYCAANENTYQLIDDVLSEVALLFPGIYIHIGGDEVAKQNWQGCSKCQEVMRREGLKDEHELQSYFVRRVEKPVNAKGKRLIGWSEIREGGLARNATVMDWIGGAVEAVTSGHDVIMSPTSHCYLDYYQSRHLTNEPPAIGGFLPLRTVYAFEPIPAGLDPRYHSRILGAQGNVWTEFIPSLKQVEYMTFPRLCALAEVVWSPANLRDWDDFTRRLEAHTRRLDALGIGYRKGFSEQ